MYSQNDLDEAVTSGALSADAATALRNFVEQQRPLPSVDEEHFRLITGFNDIFVSIAAAILLFAVGWIGQSIGKALNFVIDDRGPSPLARLTFFTIAAIATAVGRGALATVRLSGPAVRALAGEAVGDGSRFGAVM